LIKKGRKGEKVAENFATDEYYTSEDALKQKQAHDEVRNHPHPGRRAQPAQVRVPAPAHARVRVQ
jgi:hypothetical protein